MSKIRNHGCATTQARTWTCGRDQPTRTNSHNSSFPPITQWANRRPQKISRTARRTNIVPVVPSNDDIPSLDSGPAVHSPFWNQIEPHFSFPSDTDISYLKEQGSMHSVLPTTKPDVDSYGDIPLCQRLLSALITEEGDDNENDDTESNRYASAFEDETDGVSDYHTMSMIITTIGASEYRTLPGPSGKSCNSFMDNVDDEPPLHFLHLEIPEMDVLGDAFSEQSQDLGSWLNTIDDIILQDDEFIGLEIPMDDLSDIKMTV
ncbi:hypothetical protein Tco_0519702 [Tanacetum coccineum]